MIKLKKNSETPSLCIALWATWEANTCHKGRVQLLILSSDADQELMLEVKIECMITRWAKQIYKLTYTG